MKRSSSAPTAAPKPPEYFLWSIPLVTWGLLYLVFSTTVPHSPAAPISGMPALSQAASPVHNVSLPEEMSVASRLDIGPDFEEVRRDESN